MFFEAAQKKKTPPATQANHTGRSRQPESPRPPFDRTASRVGSIPPKYERPAAIDRHIAKASH